MPADSADALSSHVDSLVATYDPADPTATADAMRSFWLGLERKSTASISADLLAQQQTAGTSVPLLQAIARSVSRAAKKHPAEFLPLAELLWDRYGREGRVVAAILFGILELALPDTVLPVLRDKCRLCVTWEDADRLAMDAVEPIVRKDPEGWLGKIEPWLSDDSKWVRRTAVTVIGRLPMKRPEQTSRCLGLCEQLVADEEDEVRKAVSFAIRLCVRGDADVVRQWLESAVPPRDPSATWVLCDVIRSMAKEFLPTFAVLRPVYEAWLDDPSLPSRYRTSIAGALRMLKTID